jgi:hypothetical protein
MGSFQKEMVIALFPVCSKLAYDHFKKMKKRDENK